MELKFFDKKGEKLCDNDELKIEKNINLTEKNVKHLLKIEKNIVTFPEYENFLYERFSKLKTFNKKKYYLIVLMDR